MFLECKPEPWSRQACCDLNVLKYMETHHGEIVCGYKIWYNPPEYIEAERHAVWSNGEEYRDVSFNPDGESRILFIPDVTTKQSSLELNQSRIRWGKSSKTRQLIIHQNQNEAMNKISHMSDEHSWNTMLTYKEWLGGKRMSNFIETEL